MTHYSITIQPGTYHCGAFTNSDVKISGRSMIDYQLNRRTGQIAITREITATMTHDYLADMIAYKTGAAIEEVAASTTPAAAATPAARMATDSQRSYLRRLGYRGSFDGMTMQQASAKIDTFKTLTASDVDDFSGPQRYW